MVLLRVGLLFETSARVVERIGNGKGDKDITTSACDQPDEKRGLMKGGVQISVKGRKSSYIHRVLFKLREFLQIPAIETDSSQQRKQQYFS